MSKDRRARLLEEEDESGLLMPQGFDVTPKNDKQDLLDSIELDRYMEEMSQIREEEKANRTPQSASGFKYKDLHARQMTPNELEQYESDPDNVYNSFIRKKKR